jgi:acetyl esterase/lipase
MPSLASHVFRLAMRRSAGFFGRGGTTVEWRAKIDRVSRLNRPPRGVQSRPVVVNGVPAEWEIPPGAAKDRVILYIHGGAWVMCSPATHRRMVGQIAKAAGMAALSIDYRLAPEHPFPAALDDCLAAYRWLLAEGYTPGKIVIAGDSAGGNLTLATLLALREAGLPLPAAAVGLSPATDLTGTGESRRTRADKEVLLKGLIEGADVVAEYTGGHDRRDPLVSPLFGDLSGLPPVLIHVGDDEILLSDATDFVARAQAAGVAAEVVVWPGMWHVFQIHAPALPEARRSVEQIGDFMRRQTA